jgi:hypothetical protein
MSGFIERDHPRLAIAFFWVEAPISNPLDQVPVALIPGLASTCSRFLQTWCLPKRIGTAFVQRLNEFSRTNW